MAFPVAVIAAGAMDLIKFGIDILEARDNGATQEELNERWQRNQPKIASAKALWEASKGPQIE